MKRLLVLVVFLLSFSLASAIISVNNVGLADLGYTSFVVEANLDTSGSAQVLYGKTGALGSATSLASSSNEHLLQVNNLESGTVYFYRVVGKDNSGNTYSSAISLTRTPSQAPSTTAISLENSGTDYLQVRWYIEPSATGQVEYGTSANNLDQKTTFESRHLPRHTQNINGLQPATTYYYRGVGSDAQGNTYATPIYSSTTKATTDTDINTGGSTSGSGTTNTDSNTNTDPITNTNVDTTGWATLASYGAKGNGVTDDTAAIQAAFDKEKYIVAEAGKTYLISKSLRLTKNMAQSIDFKGSTLTTKGHGSYFIDVDKRNYANTLTTIRNLKIDGNNKNVQGIDVAGRVHFQNIDIYDMVKDFAFGARVIIYDTPGIYGQSVFDNYNIYNLKAATNNGKTGDGSGEAHAFLVSVQQVPTQKTQVVYKNSEIHDVYGEDAGGISLFSPGSDVSNSLFSSWFENIHIKDVQRRAVKGFMGGTTWINSRFTAADNDNPNLVSKAKGGASPAGLFVLGAGSSSKGSTNHLICGCTFEGAPTNPFDSWDVRVIIVGGLGPAGAEIRNSKFSGGHVSWGTNSLTMYDELTDITVANTEFATTRTVRAVGSGLTGTLVFDTNNNYVDGKTKVFEPSSLPIVHRSLPYEPCPSIG